MKILHITYLFQAIQLAIIQAFKAIGDSGTPLKLEIIKKIVEVILLLVTIKRGVLLFASSILLCSVISHVLNSVSAMRILHYSIKRQIADIIPATTFSTLMAISVRITIRVVNGDLLRLAVGIGIGVAVYLLLCTVFRIPEMKLMKNAITKSVLSRVMQK